MRTSARERGQALVEMVLTLPVLLLLLLGLICVGQILLANYTMNQAARAAAHQAAIEGGAPEAAYAAAQQVIDAGVGTAYDAAEVEVRCARTPCRRYDAVEVQISYTGAFWAPLPPIFTEFSVGASATRAAERDQQ